MKVLGIDPGSYRTGWGVVVRRGSALLHVASGVVVVGRTGLSERLTRIADALDALVRKHAPDAVAVEAVFHAKNARSALQLGHARGVAILCAGRAGLPVFEYPAAQIKQVAAGHGGADKVQVQAMVRVVLGAVGPLSLDASDALACAICHAYMYASPTARLLRSALKGAAGAKG